MSTAAQDFPGSRRADCREADVSRHLSLTVFPGCTVVSLHEYKTKHHVYCEGFSHDSERNPPSLPFAIRALAMQSKYQALYAGMQELVWLRGVLDEL